MITAVLKRGGKFGKQHPCSSISTGGSLWSSHKENLVVIFVCSFLSLVREERQAAKVGKEDYFGLLQY